VGVRECAWIRKKTERKREKANGFEKVKTGKSVK
jgi:hypothetical protein